jgi:hypothetical protein
MHAGNLALVSSPAILVTVNPLPDHADSMATAKPVNVDKLRASLSERFFEALARRRIELKEAARYAGCHEKVLGRLRRGESEKMDLAYVVAIAKSLPDGDAFIGEVTGIGQAADDMRARIQEAAVRLSPAMPDSDWWYPPYGDKVHAAPDPATALRLAYRLPGTIDAVGYGLRSLGGVLRQGIRVTYEREAASHKALLACAKHLRECFGTEAMVLVNDQPLNVRIAINLLEETAADAASALASRAHPWVIDRLSLDRIEDPLLGQFAREAAGNIDDIASYALRGGMADRCALFHVDGENVMSLWAGASLAVDRSSIIGRNVLERDDLAYARMVRAHVLEACAEGTVYREMDIPMNGLRGRYRRVAAAGRRGPDGTRQVVTLVQVVGLTAYN